MKALDKTTICFKQLNIPREELYEYFGYKNSEPDEDVMAILNKLLIEVNDICFPVYGHALVKGQRVDKKHFMLGDKTFCPGVVICKSIENCDSYILMTATVGKSFDDWLEAKTHSGDVVEAFLADGIGSAVAEATVAYAIERIKEEAESENLKITNSYSPGYCDWHVSEQHDFFSLLPSNFCGISLNDSALMHPIKSVSCVLGLDENAIKRPYGCAICKKTDCFLRIARAK